MKKYYNKILVISTVLIASISNNLSAQTWNSQNSGATNDLYTISSPSASIGFIAGEPIGLSTSDAGANWSTVSGVSSAGFLHSTSFVSTSTGWLVGGNGTIWKTTTGPDNWVIQTSPTSNTLYAVDFVNTSVVWAAGVSGTLIKTNDGTNWNTQNSGISIDIRSLDAVDENTLWVVGSSGTIRKSIDGGDNWTDQTSGTTTETFVDVFFVDANTGWVVGTNGTIKKTTDGGNNWTDQTSGTTVTLRSIHFISATQGWVVGSNGTILNTTDGGTNWSSETSGTAQALYSVSMVSATEGWAVGLGGTILAYCIGVPSQPSVITGATSICENSSQTYSVDNIPGKGYNWSLPVGWTQTAGGATNSITVTVGSGSGDIVVTPFNGCGNGTARTLTVSTTTIDNSLALSGTTLIANESGASYQWLDCDNGNSPISGETSQSFTAIVSGNYAVEITKNGCTETSACTNVTVLGIQQEQNVNLSAYPNPNNGMFTVSSSIPMMRVEVVNVVGQVVYEQNMNGQTKVDINFEGAPGIYFVRIVTTDNIVNPIIKVTKQ
jgi:photosystem II stability/assembly factor-like uncharacterized protein